MSKCRTLSFLFGVVPGLLAIPLFWIFAPDITWMSEKIRLAAAILATLAAGWLMRMTYEEALYRCTAREYDRLERM